MRIMIAVAFLALVSLQAALAAPVTLDDASQFCVTCYGRRVHKPLFINPINCHQYYNCFFYNETFASGILQDCPPGTFFNDNIQTCVPEGAVQCIDRCQDDATGTQGCYAADSSCNAFFSCSRGVSYPYCCPAGTSFNAATCGCDLSETCVDECRLPTPIPTTVAPPTGLDNGRCLDSFGVVLGVYINQLGVVDNSQFVQYTSNDADAESFVRACATGSQFSLDACRCDVPVDVVNANNYRQCLLYLPFDSDVSDYSNQKMDTNSENVDIDTTDPARGAGAAFINTNGLVRTWGSPGIDFGKTISICLFYHAGGASLTQSGGLIANSKDASSADFAYDIAALPNNTVIATFSFVNPQNVKSVYITVPNQAQYSQVCVVVADDSTITTYVNGNQQSSTTYSGRVNWGHCAAYVGNDFGQFGDFEGGHIDEVLVCREALTTAEVQAHYTGQTAIRNAGLIP